MGLAHPRITTQYYLALSLFIAICAPVTAQTLPDEIVRSVLNDGDWSDHADEDMRLQERLKTDTVRLLVASYPRDRRSIGLLSLTTSAGKWGVAFGDKRPTDPANDDWAGPPPGTGKHLMNYKTGGVGLPHLDVGSLKAFILHIAALHREIGPPSERSHLLSLGGKTFAAVRKDPIFRKWVLAGLRDEKSQRWILEHWINKYWDPALKASNGDIRLALVLARIWNTGSSFGQCAARKAHGTADPIKAALNAYTAKPCGSPKYRDRRVDYMKRPVVLYDTFHKSEN